MLGPYQDAWGQQEFQRGKGQLESEGEAQGKGPAGSSGCAQLPKRAPKAVREGGHGLHPGEGGMPGVCSAPLGRGAQDHDWAEVM